MANCIDGVSGSWEGNVKGIEVPSTANGGCASKAYQKCLYIMLDVPVRDPFFRKSFTCAIARVYAIKGNETLFH